MTEDSKDQSKEVAVAETNPQTSEVTFNDAGKYKEMAVTTATAAGRLAVQGLKLGAEATKRVGIASFNYGKHLIDQYKKSVDDQRFANFQKCEESIREYADFVSDDAIKALGEFATASSENSKAQQKFVESDLVKKLLRRAELRASFCSNEAEMESKKAVFSAVSGDLLDLIPRQILETRLNGIKKKYLWSNSGNVAASVIFGARGNGAGQAAALANSARVGHHNGKVKSAFSQGISEIGYSVNMHDIPDIQSELIRFAKRVIFFNCDEDDIAAKAHFCLVYNNGRARVSPPDYSEFSSLLDPEFHNTFRDQFWTVAECYTRLNDLSSKSKLLGRLFSEKDAKPLMKVFIDELPTYPI
jgi:hypothetical protein